MEDKKTTLNSSVGPHEDLPTKTSTNADPLLPKNNLTGESRLNDLVLMLFIENCILFPET